jgi:hypothetical protein
MSDYAELALRGKAYRSPAMLPRGRRPQGRGRSQDSIPHTGRAYILGITGPPGAGSRR